MSLHVSPVLFRFAYEVITWRGVSSRDPSTLGRGSNLPSSADQATCVHDVCRRVFLYPLPNSTAFDVHRTNAACHQVMGMVECGDGGLGRGGGFWEKGTGSHGCMGFCTREQARKWCLVFSAF
jgi:hypothetical protein